jgi:hypothetical protein
VEPVALATIDFDGPADGAVRDPVLRSVEFSSSEPGSSATRVRTPDGTSGAVLRDERVGAQIDLTASSRPRRESGESRAACAPGEALGFAPEPLEHVELHPACAGRRPVPPRCLPEHHARPIDPHDGPGGNQRREAIGRSEAPPRLPLAPPREQRKQHHHERPRRTPDTRGPRHQVWPNTVSGSATVRRPFAQPRRLDPGGAH